jgi:peptide deformylase
VAAKRQHEDGHGHGHSHEHDHEDGLEHDHEHDEADPEAQQEAEREYLRQRALAQIRQYPDPALRMKAREVTEFDDYLVQLAERMILLMADAQGVGLAATQVGVLQRLFVFEGEGEEGPHAVVNPRLVESSSEQESEEEGCLSLQGVRVPVARSTHVILEGRDPAGEEVRFDLDGLAARAVQHELDHLDGVLIIDRTDDEHRKEALGVLRPQPALR